MQHNTPAPPQRATKRAKESHQGQHLLYIQDIPNEDAAVKHCKGDPTDGESREPHQEPRRTERTDTREPRTERTDGHEETKERKKKDEKKGSVKK